MDIDQALEKIYSLKQFHVKLGLDNITHLLNHIGNPQKKIKTFHIAGSNGKGSTASFMASILKEYGYKTGLYTSPHFVKFNERIRINGKEIPDSVIIDFLEKNKNYIDKNKPTFFEITTALAFDFFAKEKVDYTIIETGLGGRLDATNTITPLASIITSISLEHSRILGDSLEKIAKEKAGIIKDKIPIFIGKLPKTAKDEIVKISKEKKSKVYVFDEFFKLHTKYIEVKLKKKNFIFKTTGLIGEHQLFNSALAVKVLSEILQLKNNKLFQTGLDNVVNNTGIQGRYEIFNKSPKVIFDSAHNPEGLKYFIKQFKKEKKLYKNTVLIFGAMNDKNTEEMFLSLKPFFNKVLITSTNYERAASIDDLFNAAKSSEMDCEKLRNPENYIEKFVTNGKDNCLVVLGSIYLLGEIKKKLRKSK